MRNPKVRPVQRISVLCTALKIRTAPGKNAARETSIMVLITAAYKRSWWRHCRPARRNAELVAICDLQDFEDGISGAADDRKRNKILEDVS
jgi:hypothetical protein